MPEKERFGVSMEAQLKEWEMKVEQAKSKAEEKGPEFMEKMRPDFERIASRFDEARYKLTLLRMGGADAWDELRAGIENAFQDLKQGMEKALSKF